MARELYTEQRWALIQIRELAADSRSPIHGLLFVKYTCMMHLKSKIKLYIGIKVMLMCSYFISGLRQRGLGHLDDPCHRLASVRNLISFFQFNDVSGPLVMKLPSLHVIQGGKFISVCELAHVPDSRIRELP